MGVSTASAEDIFGDGPVEEVKTDPQEEGKPETKENKEDTIPEGGSVNSEDIFGEDNPESVGDEENKEKGETNQ